MQRAAGYFFNAGNLADLRRARLENTTPWNPKYLNIHKYLYNLSGHHARIVWIQE